MNDSSFRRELMNQALGKDQSFMGSVAARSVEEQLRTLRANPVARSELSKRVEEYKWAGQEVGKTREIVKANAQQAAAQAKPEAQAARRRQGAERQKALMNKTKANRQALDQDLEDWRASTLNRDSFMRVRRKEMAKEAAANASVRARAELATLLVFGAARMQILSDTVLEARARRKRDANMVVGSIVVQKLWRGLRQRRRYQRIRAAVITIQRFVRTVIWSKRFERRQHASELVLAFVSELDRSSAFLRAVKELQHRLDVEQKHMAALSLSRRAHLDLVMRQWQNAEAAALEEARKAAPPKSNFKPQADDKLKKPPQKKPPAITSQQMLDAQPKSTDAVVLPHFAAVPDNVKTAVATAYLWSKREAYVRAGFDRWRLTGAYVKAWLPQHALEVARALVDAAFPGFTPFQPPAGVLFRPLAGQSELRAIMQQGVLHMQVTRLQQQEFDIAQERAKLEEQLAAKIRNTKPMEPAPGSTEASGQAAEGTAQAQIPSARQTASTTGDTDEDSDNAHLGKSIRAQHMSQELSEEEQKLVQQVQAGLMRRLAALDIKLVDCLKRRPSTVSAPQG